MEGNKKEMPDNIKSAVNYLISDFGYCIEELIKNKENPGSIEDRYMTTAQAEKYTHTSKWSLARAVRAGRLKQHKTGRSKSSRVLYLRADIDAWLKAGGMKEGKGQ
jgi:hypothetical protein